MHSRSYTFPCPGWQCDGQSRDFRPWENALWCESCGHSLPLPAGITETTDPRLVEVLALAQELKEEGLGDDEAYAAAQTFVAELALQQTDAGMLALPLARMPHAYVQELEHGVTIQREAAGEKVYLTWREADLIGQALYAITRYRQLAQQAPAQHAQAA